MDEFFFWKMIDKLKLVSKQIAKKYVTVSMVFFLALTIQFVFLCLEESHSAPTTHPKKQPH